MHLRTTRARHLLSGVAIAILLISLLTACGNPETQAGADGGLRVVATNSIVADLLRNVGGDNVQLTTLVGPGADSHTFEPSPSDSAALADADLVVENGLGFEPWLDDMYESSGSNAPRVALAEGLDDLIEASEGPGEAGHSEEQGAEGAEHAEEGEEQEHGEQDPHVWQDPNNVITMVEKLRYALSKADPDNTAAYATNAEAYSVELRELDAYIRERVETLPEVRRKLVTNHDTLGYFAQRYGFDVVTTALGGSTEESEPSAAQLVDLIGEIRAADVPAVFAENVSNSGAMERVASETGAKLAPPLYTDALGEPGSEGETYLEMMRYNADTIVEALRR